MPITGSRVPVKTAVVSSGKKSVSGGIVVGAGLSQTGWKGTGLTEVGKPLKVKAGVSTANCRGGAAP